jgi:hypothetical protein
MLGLAGRYVRLTPWRTTLPESGQRGRELRVLALLEHASSTALIVGQFLQQLQGFSGSPPSC